MKRKLRAPAAVLSATFAFGILTACQDENSTPLTAPQGPANLSETSAEWGEVDTSEEVFSETVPAPEDAVSSAATSPNLIINGGFESGSFAGWTRSYSGWGYNNNAALTWQVGASDSKSYGGGVTHTEPLAHSGTYGASATENNNTNHQLYQDVAIPSVPSGAKVSLTYRIRWKNFNNSWSANAQDIVVTLRNPSTQAIFTTLFQASQSKPAFFSGGGNATKANYEQHTFNITSYAGQTVRLQFTNNVCCYFQFMDLDDVEIIITTPDNKAPVASVGGPYKGAEASAITLALSGSDADKDALKYTWDLGDGTTASGSTPPTSHTYADNGTYTITLTVEDGKGGKHTASTKAEIFNVAPTGKLVFSNPIDEGQGITLGMIDGADVSSVDFGKGLKYALLCDASDATALAAFNAATYTSGASTTANVACPVRTDDDDVTVKSRIFDKDGGYTEYTGTVTVNNVAPVLATITGPIDPVAVGTSVSVSALFTDAGSADTHTAVIDWEGGTSVGPVVDAMAKKVSGSATYSAAGVYRVKITLTDDDGGVDAEIFEYVVVYDPSAGFVTGGGWINSPAGAYKLNTDLSGKATFGFVSKYQKGATTPTGNTEFQFHAGGMNFKSTSYEWLVVSGSKAQYKGDGTVNGVSGYEFLLTVTDGAPDKIRMRITRSSDGGVVYDNGTGSTKLSESDTQAIGGGSIVIHSK